MSDPYHHNPLPMMFEPYINWENPYKIERGGRGQAILYGYRIANFPETLDHIPKTTWIEERKKEDWGVG